MFFHENNNYLVCKCYIENNNWKSDKLTNEKVEKKFFIVDNNQISNDDFFFLMTEENYNKLNPK